MCTNFVVSDQVAGPWPSVAPEGACTATGVHDDVSATAKAYGYQMVSDDDAATYRAHRSISSARRVNKSDLW